MENEQRIQQNDIHISEQWLKKDRKRNGDILIRIKMTPIKWGSQQEEIEVYWTYPETRYNQWSVL